MRLTPGPGFIPCYSRYFSGAGAQSAQALPEPIGVITAGDAVIADNRQVQGLAAHHRTAVIDKRLAAHAAGMYAQPPFDDRNNRLDGKKARRPAIVMIGKNDI